MLLVAYDFYVGFCGFLCMGRWASPILTATSQGTSLAALRSDIYGFGPSRSMDQKWISCDPVTRRDFWVEVSRKRMPFPSSEKGPRRVGKTGIPGIHVRHLKNSYEILKS